MYEVQHLPIPKTRRPAGQRRYNFAALSQVNDSLQIPLEEFKTPAKKNAVDTVRSSLGYWKRRHGIKHSYSVLFHEIDGVPHVGVWLRELK